jgi:hypothetical protein
MCSAVGIWNADGSGSEIKLASRAAPHPAEAWQEKDSVFAKVMRGAVW